MLFHACGDFAGSRPSRGLQALQGPPGASRPSRGLHGAPEGSRGRLQKPQKTFSNLILNEKCARRVPPKPRTLGEAEISRGMVRLD